MNYTYYCGFCETPFASEEGRDEHEDECATEQDEEEEYDYDYEFD